jgi:hypothetical protein
MWVGAVIPAQCIQDCAGQAASVSCMSAPGPCLQGQHGAKQPGRLHYSHIAHRDRLGNKIRIHSNYPQTTSWPSPTETEQKTCLVTPAETRENEKQERILVLAVCVRESPHPSIHPVRLWYPTPRTNSHREAIQTAATHRLLGAFVSSPTTTLASAPPIASEPCRLRPRQRVPSNQQPKVRRRVGLRGMHSAGAEARPGHITTLGFLAMCIFANGK